MIFQFLFTIGVAMLICSCGYTTQVTRFHQLPPKGNGETFSVSAPRKAPGLETQQHLSLLSSGLVEHGWVQANSKNATYRVAIDYGIGDGRTVHGVAPIYGQTGGGTTTYHSGSAFAYGSYGGYASGSYSGTSYTPATYGIVGEVPTTQTVFDRYLLVLVFDSKGLTVMEGKCFSSGSSSNLSDVVPRMINSFLTDFPGESGKTKTCRKR